MKKILFYLLACFVFNSAKVQAQTPQGCNLNNIRAAFAAAGHYTELNVSGQPCSLYFVDESANDAATAEGLAGQLGGHLVVMNDATENSNVVAAINAAGYLAGNRKVWIGYKRTGTAAPTFYSLDGTSGPFTPGPSSPTLFQNWSSGEPNNNGFDGCCSFFCSYTDCNGEQCVQIYANGLWNDEDCSDDASKSIIEVNLCPIVTSTQDTTICAGGGVRLWATTILGSSPYNYTWTPGNLSGANHRVYPTQPTTYSLTVTDRYGCYQTASTDVSLNTGCVPPPQPLGCNITAIRNAFAAAGHYTELNVTGQDCSMYFIDENANDAAGAEGLANAFGAHLVVMNDATENTNVVAAVNAAGYLSGSQKVWIGVKRTGTAAPTFYTLDGSTGPFTPGPSTPYLYQNWAGGEPNNSGYDNCCSFFCNYTDCNGEQCVQIYSNGFWNDESCNDGGSKSIIEVNLCPDINASNDTTVCNPNPVTITTRAILGSAPYTYAWTPGGQTSSSITVTPPSTTMYKVRVTDRWSCYQEDSTLVTVIPISPPTITASSLSLCIDEIDTINMVGTYNPTAAMNWYFDGASFLGGSAVLPYYVSWSQAGTHDISLFMTDDVCTSQTTTITVTVHPNPIATAGIDVALCSDSSIILGAAPDAGNTYSWNPTLGLSNGTVANPVLTANNPTDSNIVQSFVVTETTAEGCAATDTVLVTLHPPAVTTFTINPPNACIGEAVTITYTGTNSASATYTWDFGVGTVVSGSGQGPYTVTWASSGSHPISLNVTENGCPGIPTVDSVSIGTPPPADAGADVAVCSGGTVQIGSPTQAGFTYQWSPTTSLDDATSSSPNFSFLNTSSSSQTFTYTVVMNQNGCTASDDVNVTVDAPGATTIVPQGSTTFCEGGTVTLESNDPNIVSWSWLPNGETTQSIIVATGQQFSMTGRDAQNCYYVSNAIITTQVIPPVVALAPNGLVDESCTNYNDGSITLSPTGGTPPYNYVWDDGRTTAAITGLGEGVYAVTVSDQYNCSASAQYTVDAAVDFYVNIDSAFNVSCYGFYDGEIFASSTGGAPPYAFVWSNDVTGKRNLHLPIGTYTVTASDGHGCLSDSTITLTQPDEIVATTTSNLFIEFTEETQIDVTISPSGNYTYMWSPAASLSCADCEDPGAFPAQTTVYTLVVHDEVTNCYDTTKFKLEVDASKRIYIPNAFTPNGDGKNDVWQVFSKGVKYFKVQIFNRWGEKVFETLDITRGWDGTFHGAAVNPGIYTYIVAVTYLDSERVNQSGTITVVK